MTSSSLPIDTPPLIHSNALPRANDAHIPVGALEPTFQTPATPSRAARLLSTDGDTPSGNASRLLVGLGGIAMLGLISPSAIALARGAGAEIGVLRWLAQCGLQMSEFAVVAALALTMSLPGLWILLGLFDVRLELHTLLNGVCRAYMRAGLFCLGFVPCILLYATTGADLDMTMLSALACYLAAGAVGLQSLTVDLGRALPARRALGKLVILGWLVLSTVLGCNLFLKMHIWLVIFEGGSL
jgi:hypothetical protein